MKKKLSYILLVIEFIVILISILWSLYASIFMFDSPQSSATILDIIKTIIMSLIFIWIYPIILVLTSIFSYKNIKKWDYKNAIIYIILWIFLYPLIRIIIFW